MSITVYLDTNILSRITDQRISDETAEAYARISELPGLKLVTSEKTRQEIAAVPNASRAAVLKFILAQFAKVPWTVPSHSGALGVVPLGMCSLGTGYIHPTLERLRSIFDSDDAEHILQASRAQCDYFLTLDERTILRPARANETTLLELCGPMKFRSPIELITERVRA